MNKTRPLITNNFLYPHVRVEHVYNSNYIRRKRNVLLQILTCSRNKVAYLLKGIQEYLDVRGFMMFDIKYNYIDLCFVAVFVSYDIECNWLFCCVTAITQTFSADPKSQKNYVCSIELWKTIHKNPVGPPLLRCGIYVS